MEFIKSFIMISLSTLAIAFVVKGIESISQSIHMHYQGYTFEDVNAMYQEISFYA